jgi:hypothetical protein
MDKELREFSKSKKPAYIEQSHNVIACTDNQKVVIENHTISEKLSSSFTFFVNGEKFTVPGKLDTDPNLLCFFDKKK